MEQELPDDAPEELTVEDLQKQLEDRDPYDARLKAITGDCKVKVGEGTCQDSWIVRHMGDKDNYGADNASGKKVNFGTVVVRSL
jgi:hypothetical protein